MQVAIFGERKFGRYGAHSLTIKIKRTSLTAKCLCTSAAIQRLNGTGQMLNTFFERFFGTSATNGRYFFALFHKAPLLVIRYIKCKIIYVELLGIGN